MQGQVEDKKITSWQSINEKEQAGEVECNIRNLHGHLDFSNPISRFLPYATFMPFLHIS